MTSGMTDIHQHLLWGLDDGAQTPESMQDMLLEARRQGIGQIAATCHVCPGMEPFDEGLYRERLAEAQAFSHHAGLGVQVLPGAEVAWTYQTVTALRQGKALRLGNTDAVLLELWQDVSLHEARRAVRSLISAGYCPVLAHVERYQGFTSWATIEQLREASQQGSAVQALLQRVDVEPGDVLYIPSGMVHAIGKGIMLYEIQQSSDVTYRFYDWDRVDQAGKKRELHLDKALDVTDLTPTPLNTHG